MIDVQVAAVGGIKCGQCYLSESSDFPSSGFTFHAVYPRPSGRPSRKSSVGYQRMVSKQRREPPLFGLPATTDPALKLGRFLKLLLPYMLVCTMSIKKTQDSETLIWQKGDSKIGEKKAPNETWIARTVIARRKAW